jgi:hypothetical protein
MCHGRNSFIKDFRGWGVYGGAPGNWLKIKKQLVFQTVEERIGEESSCTAGRKCIESQRCSHLNRHQTATSQPKSQWEPK